MSGAVEAGLLLHQGLLFVHVIAFAMTVSAVLREDLRWLRRRRVDARRLRRTMRTVAGGLVVLWATGLGLWAFAAASSPVAWGLTAKLGAKLLVVCVLTLNGWALHAWVFPSLQAGSGAEFTLPRLAAIVGAVSSASWLFAGFVGVARLVADALSFGDFVALYGACVGVALAVALLASRPGRGAAARAVPASTITSPAVPGSMTADGPRCVPRALEPIPGAHDTTKTESKVTLATWPMGT